LVFGDDVLASAIVDRLLHHSHALMIQGESHRCQLTSRSFSLSTFPRRPSRRTRIGPD
jgi:hypothetical protein